MANKVVIQIDGDNSGFKKKLDELENESKNTGDQIGDNLTMAGNKAEKASGGFSILKGAIAGLVYDGFHKLSAAITGEFSNAISRVDTINSYKRTMESLGYAATDVAAAQSALSDSIQKLPTSTPQILQMQQRYAALTGDLDKATQLTIALNDATLAGGQGMEIASGAAEQWYQMIANGMPDLQSWRIINSAMPAQLNQIAEACMGSGAKAQDLFKAWQEGTVTTDQVTDALMKLDKEGLGALGSFSEQAEAASGGIGMSFDTLKGKIAGAIAEVINAIGSENIANAIQDITDLIINVGKVSGKVTGFIVKHWDTIAPVLAVVGGALAGLAVYMTALTVKTKLMAAAQLVLNAAMDANPIGIVIIAVTALIAGIVALYNHSETFRNFCKDFYAKIQPAIETVKGWLSSAWELIKAACVKIQPAVEFVFNFIWTAVQMYIGFVIDFLTAAWNAIKYVWDAVKPYFEAIWKFISKVFSVAESVLGGFFRAAYTAVTTIWNGAKFFFSTVWEGIKVVFSGVVESFRSWFQSAFDKVKSIFTVENFRKIFHDSIIGGLNKIKKDAEDAAGKIFNAIKNAFKKAINITFGFGGEGGGGIIPGGASAGGLAPFTSARISSPYGVTRPGHKHAGVDLAAPTGTPIQSVVAGRVTRVQHISSGYGNNVIVTAADGTQFLYGHMSRTTAKVGMPVMRGGLLGYVGSTGHSTGPHLHFEVRSGGAAINPMKWYYSARGYALGGFPGNGDFFRANENGIEMIGKWKGRQNVVANNLQIIEGIKQGVYNGLLKAAQGNTTNNQNVTQNLHFYKEQVSPSDLKRAARRAAKTALAGGF